MGLSHERMKIREAAASFLPSVRSKATACCFDFKCIHDIMFRERR